MDINVDDWLWYRFDWSKKIPADCVITEKSFDVPPQLTIAGESIDGHTTAAFIDAPRGRWDVTARIAWASHDGKRYGREFFTATICPRPNP